IFGAVIDDKMGDEVRVTVIATGFDQPAQMQQINRYLNQTNTNINTQTAHDMMMAQAKTVLQNNMDQSFAQNAAYAGSVSSSMTHAPVSQSPMAQPTAPIDHQAVPVSSETPAVINSNS